MVEKKKKKEDKASQTKPWPPFQSPRDGTLGQAGSTRGAGWTPLCPGVMLQAAAAVPDLCQHG